MLAARQTARGQKSPPARDSADMQLRWRQVGCACTHTPAGVTPFYWRVIGMESRIQAQAQALTCCHLVTHWMEGQGVDHVVVCGLNLDQGLRLAQQPENDGPIRARC